MKLTLDKYNEDFQQWSELKLKLGQLLQMSPKPVYLLMFDNKRFVTDDQDEIMHIVYKGQDFYQIQKHDLTIKTYGSFKEVYQVLANEF